MNRKPHITQNEHIQSSALCTTHPVQSKQCFSRGNSQLNTHTHTRFLSLSLFLTKSINYNKMVQMCFGPFDYKVCEEQHRANDDKTNCDQNQITEHNPSHIRSLDNGCRFRFSRTRKPRPPRRRADCNSLPLSLCLLTLQGFFFCRSRGPVA